MLKNSLGLAFFIARRYFLSRKKKSFINIISIISMFVVAIGTMALIIVLSVFNGLEGLLRNLYSTVDPDLVVTASVGKSFVYTEELGSKIKKAGDIVGITEVLEDNALIKYNNAQRVARVKGVSENFITQGRLEDFIVYGELKLKSNDTPYAIVGRGVQYDLAINPSNDFYTLQMYYPKDLRPGLVNPERMYQVKNILPGGVFAVEKYYDENYVYVPIAFTEELFEKEGRRSSIEIQLAHNEDVQQVKDHLSEILGENYKVQSNEELHGDLYQVLKLEKFFVFLTFSIIIAIASINIFFSLNMLAIDKKKDISILASQGAPKKLIRNIFLLEGCIVAFTGAFTGLILGLTISFIQQEYGVISMGMQTAIMEAYPIKVEWFDVLLTVLCIIVITIITAIHPAISASRDVQIKTLQ